MALFLSPEEAVLRINDNDTLAVCGATAIIHPEVLSAALEKRFLQTGHPRNLTLVFTAGQGDGGDYGMNHYHHEGFARRIIGGHLNTAPKLGKLILDGKVEAYNLPQGVLAHMMRDTAAGKIGTLTHVGLKTFVDPRLQGGKLNAATTCDLVELVHLGGKEQLLYKTFPITVCMIRGTTADEKGNISMENEPCILETLPVAMATKNSGGRVIIQVERVAKAGSLHPRSVVIPYIYVDSVVVVRPEENIPRNDPLQAYAFSGEIRVPARSLPPAPLDERKIIARRAAMELRSEAVVNLGVGIPEVVGMVAHEERISEDIALTVEHGPVGGVPAGGLLFGAATNPDCILDSPAQFDFYDGGGLDLAFLGLGEVDESGNVNVSKMGSRIAGCGGFINITQNAKHVFFCGTFTTKGLKINIKDSAITIEREGEVKKFVRAVEQITFSGEYARDIRQPVLYITERAVFALKADGVHLVEIAPGLDLQKDILAHMDFAPKIDSPPKLMDARIFRPEPMGLKIPPPGQTQYDASVL
jgi:propionate CoA-transferase